MATEPPGEPERPDMRRVFSQALAMAEVAVFGFDSAGRLAVVNTKGETLTGYGAAELLGTDPFPRLFGDRADAVRRRWFAASEAAPVTMDAPLRTRGRAETAVRWHVASHLPGSGESPALVVVGLERTRFRDLEPKTSTNKGPGTGVLAAGLAHEIRNPLNGASLHLSVLERALSRVPNLPAAAAEAITVLRSETKRLSALVTDFLDVARPRQLARDTCDVNEIVRGTAALLEREIDERAILLSLEPSPEPALAELDAEHIKRALLNLLRNAVEATGKGGRVTLRSRHMPDRVEIDVEDNGAGIADPEAPIFDAFYTTKERGTGLGLSIVQRVVSDHGGEVFYKSEPGRTVFTIRLPIGSAVEGG
jgi:PAS domain S-box-containing protein